MAVDRRLPAGHTALGRAVVGLVRAALADGSAADLLAWLRAPGHLDVPALADRLEAEVRRTGVADAAGARALWEAAHPTFPLAALDRLREAAGRGPRALRDRLGAEALRLLSAPHRGQAAILEGAETLDARVAAALRRALDELVALAGHDAALWPAPAALADALAAVEVPAADRSVPGAVAVTSPLALRARRVRALVVARLQEGTFPAPPRPEPFLGDADRRALNAASGLRLRLHEDALDRERALFYAAVSRPTERLALGWHVADDDGAPRVPSLLLSDVRDLFAPSLWERRRRRALGAVERAAEATRDGAPARPAHEPGGAGRARRAPGRLGLGAGGVGGLPRALVRRALPVPGRAGGRPRAAAAGRPGARRPGGGPAHRLGRRPPDPGARCPRRVRCWGGCWARRADHPLSPNPDRSRAILRRLESDVWRELERHAHDGGRYVPTHFELTFGGEGDDHPAVELAGGELVLRGRVDRVDLSPDGRRALVVDYKGRSGAAPQERWRADHRLQVGLYLLALGRLLGVEPQGGLYQPLGGKDTEPRGLLRDDADDGLTAKRPDRVDERGLRGRAGRRRGGGGAGRGRAAGGAPGGPPGDLRLPRGLRAPVDLPVRGGVTTATVPGPAFSAEQDAAIDRRDGPLLLAANAGSGKTSVLVERFVRMVADDGLAPGRILAITFTEKAAGELRDRIRARLLERGLRDAARDAEGAWISTVHGFCARVLRAHAVAAGLDPGFGVLDEPAARALRREAFDVALGPVARRRRTAVGARARRRRRLRRRPAAASSWARSTTSCAARAAPSRCRARPRPTSRPRPRGSRRPPPARSSRSPARRGR